MNTFSKTEERGAIIVEATLVLSAFILAMVRLLVRTAWWEVTQNPIQSLRAILRSPFASDLTMS